MHMSFPIVKRRFAPWVLGTVLFLALGFSACVDQDFDEPPVGDLTEIEANTTIAQLASRFTSGQDPIQITENVVIKGVVIADDKSGNFYKQIVIQDNTGGIVVRMNSTGLFGQFPLGKEVFVSCNGLYLADYNGVIQLNGSAADGIEELLISRHVFAGPGTQTITPKKVTIDQLGNNLLSTLIQLDGVQFKDGSAGVSYADAAKKLSKNLEVTDCSGKTVILRSSGFADFAAQLAPTQNGSLVAVYSVFGTTKQLYIRDLTDVKMTDVRCTVGSGGGGNPGGTGTPVDTLNESFSAEKNNDPIVKNGWTTVATTGTRVWIGKLFSGNTYAQATAFSDTNTDMETWLVSPPVDLKTNKILSFESAMAFYVHDGLSVWISSNYDGKNPKTATWTPLNGKLAGKSSGDNTFVASGDIPLAATGGNVHIGFKYVGNKATNTTTYRIDNVRVRKG